ncbi:MAG: hypothetical protein KDA59_25750, partial [Planctomycetales bacterium]|nr:hypothetical protein [Planctomycetales bacterium]
MRTTHELIEALRDNDPRRRLWAATFAGGFGGKAIDSLSHFAEVIDEIVNDTKGDREAYKFPTEHEEELFLGRGIVSMAAVASAIPVHDACRGESRQMVLRSMETLSRDSRIQVIGHLVFAIEKLGVTSEGTASQLEM